MAYHPDLFNKRIFVVEDDVLNLYVISRPLTECGAQVYSNYNSIGIVAHIIEHLPIDVILLDIMLRNGINGYDIFLQLSQNPRLQNIPVVAVTSLDPESEIPKVKEMGFAGFISKPINARSFAQDVAGIINKDSKWIVSR